MLCWQAPPPIRHNVTITPPHTTETATTRRAHPGAGRPRLPWGGHPHWKGAGGPASSCCSCSNVATGQALPGAGGAASSCLQRALAPAREKRCALQQINQHFIEMIKLCSRSTSNQPCLFTPRSASCMRRQACPLTGSCPSWSMWVSNCSWNAVWAFYYL